VRIGIDLGGTKIEAIALLDDGSILLRRRIATPAGGVGAIRTAIQTLIQEIEEQAGQTGSIGIGMPGAVSPASGLIKNSNSVCLNGQPFAQELQSLLGRELRFANDADCMALSEASDGAGQGARIVFAAILGTGTGGGIVIDGKLLSGVNAICGEWGHNPLPWPNHSELPGPVCYCGKSSCIETWLSGPGFSRDYAHETGQSLSPEQIALLAEQGDSSASRVMRRYEDRLARSLATVINVLDPQVCVLAGGMSNIQRLYREVPARLGDYVFSDRVDTRILPAMHGAASGVRGAAWLWPLADSEN
jgi:fructokinase